MFILRIDWQAWSNNAGLKQETAWEEVKATNFEEACTLGFNRLRQLLPADNNRCIQFLQGGVVMYKDPGVSRRMKSITFRRS